MRTRGRARFARATLPWLAVLAAMTGCGREAPPDALFPLRAGHRWVYRVTTQWSDGKTEEDTLTLTALGEERLRARTDGGESGRSGGPSGGPSASPSMGPSAGPSAGSSGAPSAESNAGSIGAPSAGQSAAKNAGLSEGPSASPSGAPSAGQNARPSAGQSAGEQVAWRRHGDDGLDYWVQADAAGIRRVATRALLDAEPRADPPDRYVLKAPYTVGTGWTAFTTAYLLTRKFDFPHEVRHTYAAVPMAYRIEAENEAVDAPAGRYTGCLRVLGTASIRVYADPVAGWRELPLTTLEWYCRGVGLVRVVRTEPATSPFMIGGTRTLELVAFK